MPGNTVLRKFAFRSAAVLVGVCVTFLLCEAFFRYMYRPWIEFRQFSYQDSNQKNKVQVKGKVLWFRTPPFTRKKNPGVFRVLCVGDSRTWGDKIRDFRLTWPYLLKESLEERLPGRDIEVINLGYRGFSTVNERELLDSLGFGLGPDLIVVQYSLNDPLKSYPGFRSDEEFNPPAIRNPLLKKSFFLGYLHHLYITKQFHGTQKRLRSLYKDGYPGWKDCVAAMSAIRSEAGRRGIGCVMMIFPQLTNDRKLPVTGYKFSGLHEKVSQTASRLGFRVLDLLPYFLRETEKSGMPWTAWKALELDTHPGEKAHRLAAETLAGYLIDYRLCQ
jgi:lysophospholipase L1-like esterase